MTGTSVTSAEVDARRRKVLFRAWHRGMREMDLLLGSYVDARIVGWSDDQLAVFEALMDVPDQTLFGWVVGRMPIDPEHDTAIFADFLAFHAGTEIAKGLYDL
ncbi:antitoxin CptB [Pseudoxanthobacter soli DSM 19599]|uniref:FAD assembly factor SdhE n=1 Tax=Pseudoxanthobacter soli DSM 19599 TaxID=1123029 RepID=A0A1M7Z8H2_9HYPH|nr:succinate dehydrogenase assembly factor 2 [Pseudoxanthobacter soli]SHO61129.1 antitoxin CptB [Pseudoxanthobacter soli DSM 19599]